MKKLFCIFLSLMMVLSLAACGKEEPSDEKKSDKKKDEVSSPTTSNSPSADKSPVVDDFNKVKTFKAGTAFSEGIALVATGYNPDTQKDTYAIIDTKGQILHEFEISLWQYGLTYADAFKNGVLVMESDICDKEGNIVASSADNEFTKLLTDARVDGKILAVKIDGDTASFGVLNTKGEWVEPISETHPLSVYFKENRNDVNGISFFNNFVSEEVFWVADNCYYNMKTGEITKYFNNYEDRQAETDDGKLTYNVYHINDSDEETCVVKGICLENRGVNGFLGYYYTDSDKPDAYYFFDYQGNEIIKFDVSYVYEFEEVDGYIIARCKDHTGNFFTCIYKANGEKVAEHMNVNWSLSDVEIFPAYSIFGIQDHYFDFTGKEIVFDGYTFGSFGEGLFFARDAQSNNCYIDLNGKKVIG